MQSRCADIKYRRWSKNFRNCVSDDTNTKVMNLLGIFNEYYGLLKTSVKYQTKEFFDNSTLHGIRYIAEEGRAFFEKFMWFCLVSTGAVAAFVIIGTLWEKFQTNPTITGEQKYSRKQEK